MSGRAFAPKFAPSTVACGLPTIRRRPCRRAVLMTLRPSSAPSASLDWPGNASYLTPSTLTDHRCRGCSLVHRLPGSAQIGAKALCQWVGQTVVVTLDGSGWRGAAVPEVDGFVAHACGSPIARIAPSASTAQPRDARTTESSGAMCFHRPTDGIQVTSRRHQSHLCPLSVRRHRARGRRRLGGPCRGDVVASGWSVPSTGDEVRLQI